MKRYRSIGCEVERRPLAGIKAIPNHRGVRVGKDDSRMLLQPQHNRNLIGHLTARPAPLRSRALPGERAGDVAFPDAVAVVNS